MRKKIFFKGEIADRIKLMTQIKILS